MRRASAVVACFLLLAPGYGTLDEAARIQGEEWRGMEREWWWWACPGVLFVAHDCCLARARTASRQGNRDGGRERMAASLASPHPHHAHIPTKPKPHRSTTPRSVWLAQSRGLRASLAAGVFALPSHPSLAEECWSFATPHPHTPTHNPTEGGAPNARSGRHAGRGQGSRGGGGLCGDQRGPQGQGRSGGEV